MKQKEWSAGHFTKSARAFERDIYPAIGKLPIASITPAIVAKAVEDINKRDVLDTATRILQHLNGVFRYAQAKGLCRDNPAGPAREILPRRKNNGRMPALLDWVALGDLLRRAEMARLSPAVRMAHRLLAFTSARIGNVVNAEWREFHLEDDQPVWIIPRAKLKLAGKHSPHGWRSAFSTLACDLGFERDVVELALDHAHDNEVARAYDRGERFTQRVELLNWWGEQLAAAQRGATIIPLKTKAA